MEAVGLRAMRPSCYTLPAVASRHEHQNGPPPPLLLVDVDGVLSLFGFDPHDPPPGSFTMVEGIAHYLALGAGERLGRLARAFELVWCSGWEERANEHLPRLLGLPGELPYISFDRCPVWGDAHWKLTSIDAFVGPDRPLAWIDDNLDERCHRWAARRPAPTLLVETHPARGMTEREMEILLAWASRMRAGQADP